MRIDELERLVAVQRAAGEGEGYVIPLHQTGNDTSRRIPSFKVDMKREIYLAVLRGGVINRADIAKAVGRKKTPWLIGQIESLVESGYLNRRHGEWKNGVIMFWYEVAQ